jgi:hypothetical protein
MIWDADRSGTVQPLGSALDEAASGPAPVTPAATPTVAQG